MVQFKLGGELKNPWGEGKWGQIKGLPQILGVDWSCSHSNPIVTIHMGNALHVACLDMGEKTLSSIRVPDGVLNLGALIAR